MHFFLNCSALSFFFFWKTRSQGERQTLKGARCARYSTLCNRAHTPLLRRAGPLSFLLILFKLNQSKKWCLRQGSNLGSLGSKSSEPTTTISLHMCPGLSCLVYSLSRSRNPPLLGTVFFWNSFFLFPILYFFFKCMIFFQILWTIFRLMNFYLKSMNFFKLDAFFQSQWFFLQNRWTIFVNFISSRWTFLNWWNIFQIYELFSKLIKLLSTWWTFSSKPMNYFQINELFFKMVKFFQNW